MIQITFLATPEQVAAQWPRIEHLIERCVSEAVKGEFTAADIYERALRGDALPFYGSDGDEVTIAGALEIVRYPRKTALSVMAMAGSRLAESAADAFGEITKFGRGIGADFIEASAPPAVARLLRMTLGFEPQYQVLRINLQGENHVLQT
jgi:hypothetical protein